MILQDHADISFFFQFRALLGWWLLMEEVPHSEELELHIPFGFAAICVV